MLCKTRESAPPPAAGAKTPRRPSGYPHSRRCRARSLRSHETALRIASPHSGVCLFSSGLNWMPHRLVNPMDPCARGTRTRWAETVTVNAAIVGAGPLATCPMFCRVDARGEVGAPTYTYRVEHPKHAET